MDLAYVGRIQTLETQNSILRWERDAFLTALAMERLGKSREAICQDVLGRPID